MLKHSIFWNLLIDLNNGIANAFVYSTLVNVIKGFFVGLRKIFRQSVVYRFFDCFLGEDEKWRNTVSYRIFTRPFKGILFFLGSAMGRALESAVINSSSINLWKGVAPALIKGMVFYLGIAFALIFGVYSALFYLYNHTLQGINAYLALALAGIVLTMAGRLRYLEGIIRGSYMVNIIKDFWNSTD